MCLDLKIFEDRMASTSPNRPSYKRESEVRIVNFSVISKKTGITYEVYAIKDNSFLIYCNNSFGWYSMNLFRPTRKTEQERLGETELRKSMFKSQKKELLYP